MLTRLDDKTLVRYGTRYRTRYLLEQARYTLKLAGSEQPPLDLPKGYLARLEETIARLEMARDDRELAEVEGQRATSLQNALMAEGMVWRRQVAMRAKRAARLGANIPKELSTIGRTTTVPKLLESMGTMIRMLREFAPALASTGEVESLLIEGRRLHDALAEADAQQEVKRLQDLPEKVRELLRLKGELYVAIKVVNDAGKERHLRNPHAASKYRLSILYRSAGRPADRTETTEETDPS